MFKLSPVSQSLDSLLWLDEGPKPLKWGFQGAQSSASFQVSSFLGAKAYFRGGVWGALRCPPQLPGKSLNDANSTEEVSHTQPVWQEGTYSKETLMTLFLAFSLVEKKNGKFSSILLLRE